MLSSLRSQIKSWERDFKLSHGRDPSIQDIKDQPPIGILSTLYSFFHSTTFYIAEKYKLYKKLSNAAHAVDTQPTSSPPTPPRSHKHATRPSQLLSKPRLVESTPPLSSYNPFSPVKKQ